MGKKTQQEGKMKKKTPFRRNKKMEKNSTQKIQNNNFFLEKIIEKSIKKYKQKVKKRTKTQQMMFLKNGKNSTKNGDKYSPKSFYKNVKKWRKINRPAMK